MKNLLSNYLELLKLAPINCGNIAQVPKKRCKDVSKNLTKFNIYSLNQEDKKASGV